MLRLTDRWIMSLIGIAIGIVMAGAAGIIDPATPLLLVKIAIVAVTIIALLDASGDPSERII